MAHPDRDQGESRYSAGGRDIQEMGPYLIRARPCHRQTLPIPVPVGGGDGSYVGPSGSSALSRGSLCAQSPAVGIPPFELFIKMFYVYHAIHFISKSTGAEAPAMHQAPARSSVRPSLQGGQAKPKGGAQEGPCSTRQAWTSPQKRSSLDGLTFLHLKTTQLHLPKDSELPLKLFSGASFLRQCF